MISCTSLWGTPMISCASFFSALLLRGATPSICCIRKQRLNDMILSGIVHRDRVWRDLCLFHSLRSRCIKGWGGGGGRKFGPKNRWSRGEGGGGKERVPFPLPPPTPSPPPPTVFFCPNSLPSSLPPFLYNVLANRTSPSVGSGLK